ncbi:MAG TPA: TVP38/TMEM64 family protein [Anaerolineae bacterium]|nr:TVP38/TMEM64 family protein [Anaerolineae bacterium]
MSERRAPVRWWVWLLAGLGLVVLVAALIIWWQPIYDFLSDPDQVRGWIEKLGALGPLAIILLEMIQALLAPIPGQAIEAVSGYLFGPWLGTLYPMIGLALGSFITFLLARRFGRPLVVKLIGQQSMSRLDDLVRRGGAPFFFLIWLLPFAPDDLACVAAGLTPMPTRQFLVLMILGRLPGVFVSVLVGANVARIEPIWWILLFVAIALAALVLWRWGERIQESVLGFIEKLSKQKGS